MRQETLVALTRGLGTFAAVFAGYKAYQSHAQSVAYEQQGSTDALAIQKSTTLMWSGLALGLGTMTIYSWNDPRAVNRLLTR